MIFAPVPLVRSNRQTPHHWFRAGPVPIGHRRPVAIVAYELLLPGKTTATLPTALHSPFIETLRLSGTVRIANLPSITLKNLKHLTINNIQGSYFGNRDFSQDFPSISTLESFIYSQTEWLSFELRASSFGITTRTSYPPPPPHRTRSCCSTVGNRRPPQSPIVLSSFSG